MRRKVKEHSPTLDTILMVEKALKNAPDSIVHLSELKRLLPRQVNHNTLKTILIYLEKEMKIVVGIKGIVWVHNPSKKMQDALKKSYRYPEDFAEK